MTSHDVVRFSIRLPSEQATQLAKWADQLSLSKSQIISRALSFYEPGVEHLPELFAEISAEIQRLRSYGNRDRQESEAAYADYQASSERFRSRVQQWIEAHPGEVPSLDALRGLDS